VGPVLPVVGENIKGILFSGVDVVNAENNHMGNYGLDGINSTLKLLNDSAISVSGNDAILYRVDKGVKFAFLGYDDLTGKLKESTVRLQITEVAKN
jgi:hypothetical protein